MGKFKQIKKFIYIKIRTKIKQRNNESSKLREENSNVIRKKSSIKDSKNFYSFNFFNKLCIKNVLPLKKRIFISIAEEIISNKISIENIMEMSIKLEILKNFTLTEEESKHFDKIPLFSLNDHFNGNYSISI